MNHHVTMLSVGRYIQVGEYIRVGNILCRIDEIISDNKILVTMDTVLKDKNGKPYNPVSKVYE